MAKQFFTNGTGSQQTLTPSQNEKVAIYDTVADAEADLANLEEGQVVATPDTGNELAQPVDTVTSGNMHAVTSNAVAGALSGKLDNTIPTIEGTQVDGLSDSQIGIYKVRNYNIGWVYNDGFILHFPWSDQYAYQIAFDDQTNWLAVRYKTRGTWNAWKVLSYAETDDNDLVDLTNQMTLYLGLIYVKARRVNNMVYLYLYGEYTGQQTNGTQLFAHYLPEKYRPRIDMEGFAILGYQATQYTTIGRLSVSHDGVINLQETAWLNGTAIRGTIIYFI